jgi:uncharacterized membrane protein YdbT with pleckstrin-like domain
MDTLARLKSIPLFAALAPEDLARVAQIATTRFYPKGSFLCQQEEFGETLYIIDSGEAILRQTDLRGLERPTGVLKAGQSFGEDALLLGNAYGACVQAITPVEVVCIHNSEFDLLRQERPQIEKHMRIPSLIKEQLRTRALPGQDPDEPWLLRRSRHWFAFVARSFVAFLAAAALIIVALGSYLLGVNMDALLLVFALATIMLGGWIAWLVVDWMNDYYLVTSERILHRELSLFQLERREEAPLTKIQNINTRQKLLGKMLGFGDLRLDTAGAGQPIMLTYLRDPEGMKEVILKQAGYLQSKVKKQERDEIRQELQRSRTGETVGEVPTLPLPPQEPPKRTGLWAWLSPARPLLNLRYEQGNQITWRKHWIFLLRRVYLAVPFFLLVSTVLIALFVFAGPSDYRLPLSLGCLCLWLAAVCWIWWEWTDWRNDEYIVTDSVIIDITRKPLFFDEVRKEAPLDMIQSIVVEKPGILAALLNVGNVRIQTAGPQGTLDFAGVHRPNEVQQDVFRRLEAYRAARQRREREQRKAELSTWFQVYDELRPSGPPPADG